MTELVLLTCCSCAWCGSGAGSGVGVHGAWCSVGSGGSGKQMIGTKAVTAEVCQMVVSNDNVMTSRVEC